MNVQPRPFVHAGDDLIGPRDIKRGVHLLTNAEMALLIEDAEAEAAQEQQPAHVLGRLKRRDSAVLRGEKLTEEQITQVHTTRPLLAQTVPCRTHQATTHIRHSRKSVTPRVPCTDDCGCPADTREDSAGDRSRRSRAELQRL